MQTVHTGAIGPIPSVEAIDGTGKRSEASEFDGRKGVVLGSFLGFFTLSSSILTFSMGVFSSEFAVRYGWSRADIAVSYSLFNVVMLLGSMPSGWLADRWGPGKLATVGATGFGLGLIAVPHIVHDITSLWVAYVLISILGLGATNTVMVKPVILAFNSKRGIATGMALCGSGIAGFAIPPLTNFFIEKGGWQLGYTGLGCMVLAAVPVIWITLGRRGTYSNVIAPTAADTQGDEELEGLTFRQALAKREFWSLSAIAILTTMGLSGFIPHVVPMLRDSGISAGTAALYASLLGVASVFGRLGSGWALDRLHGRTVALIFFVGGGLGVMSLAHGGPAFAPLAIILVGLALGSEIDLLAYLTSRYFGRAYHGTLFGWSYAMAALGSIFSPVVVGALRDYKGDYSLALAYIVTAFGVSCVLCLSLGRYRYSVRGH